MLTPAMIAKASTTRLLQRLAEIEMEKVEAEGYQFEELRGEETDIREALRDTGALAR